MLNFNSHDIVLVLIYLLCCNEGGSLVTREWVKIEEKWGLGKPLLLSLFHYIWKMWTKILLQFHFLQLVVLFMHSQIIIEFMKMNRLFFFKNVSNEAILRILFVNLEEQLVIKQIFEVPSWDCIDKMLWHMNESFKQIGLNTVLTHLLSFSSQTNCMDKCLSCRKTFINSYR